MLTETQTAEYKDRLLKKKNELMEKIDRLSVPKDFGSESADRSDEEADEAEELGNRLSIAQALKVLVNEIDQAIDRISGGEYGTCTACGKEIQEGVLKVAPESSLCEECKANN